MNVCLQSFRQDAGNVLKKSPARQVRQCPDGRIRLLNPSNEQFQVAAMGCQQGIPQAVSQFGAKGFQVFPGDDPADEGLAVGVRSAGAYP